MKCAFYILYCILLFGILLITTACVSGYSGRNLNVSAMDQIQIGETTRQEVLLHCGEPYKAYTSADYGNNVECLSSKEIGDVWIYDFSEGGLIRKENRRGTFVFSADGKVIDFYVIDHSNLTFAGEESGSKFIFPADLKQLLKDGISLYELGELIEAKYHELPQNNPDIKKSILYNYVSNEGYVRQLRADFDRDEMLQYIYCMSSFSSDFSLLNPDAKIGDL